MLLPVIAFALGSLAATAQAPAAPTAETVPPALEGAIDKTYAGANAIVVKTADGISHLFHFTKRTAVHGVPKTDAALSGLTEGARVVVHYAVDGTGKTALEVDRIGKDGLREMSGVVVAVDRLTKRLSLQLADGSRETLELSDRAARNVGKDTGEAATVIVYYADEGGHKVAHYFRQIAGD
jgi:hypothetical protein